MKVYVLSQYQEFEDGSADELLGVYATREDAENALADIKDADSWEASRDCSITEYEPQTVQPVVIDRAYKITLERDGDRDIWRRVDDSPDPGWELVPGDRMRHTRLEGTWYGASAQEARGKAHAVRDQYISRGEWPEEPPTAMEQMMASLSIASTPFLNYMMEPPRTVAWGQFTAPAPQTPDSPGASQTPRNSREP